MNATTKFFICFTAWTGYFFNETVNGIEWSESQKCSELIGHDTKEEAESRASELLAQDQDLKKFEIFSQEIN